MSYRIMHKFWLDLDKQDHEEINEIIHVFKRTRAYSKAVRDGIRLICDLRAGRLDVLFELFPWVRAEFLEYMQSLQPAQNTGSSDLQKRLDSLEKLLLQQGNVPLEPSASGPKPLMKPTASAPKSDDVDDDLLVMRKAQSNTRSAQNFVDSAFALIG